MTFRSTQASHFQVNNCIEVWLSLAANADHKTDARMVCNCPHPIQNPKSWISRKVNFKARERPHWAPETTGPKEPQSAFESPKIALFRLFTKLWEAMCGGGGGPKWPLRPDFAIRFSRNPGLGVCMGSGQVSGHHELLQFCSGSGNTSHCIC